MMQFCKLQVFHYYLTISRCSHLFVIALPCFDKFLYIFLQWNLHFCSLINCVVKTSARNVTIRINININIHGRLNTCSLNDSIKFSSEKWNLLKFSQIFRQLIMWFISFSAFLYSNMEYSYWAWIQTFFWINKIFLILILVYIEVHHAHICNCNKKIKLKKTTS